MMLKNAVATSSLPAPLDEEDESTWKWLEPIRVTFVDSADESHRGAAETGSILLAIHPSVVHPSEVHWATYSSRACRRLIKNPCAHLGACEFHDDHSPDDRRVEISRGVVVVETDTLEHGTLDFDEERYHEMVSQHHKAIEDVGLPPCNITYPSPSGGPRSLWIIEDAPDHDEYEARCLGLRLRLKAALDPMLPKGCFVDEETKDWTRLWRACNFTRKDGTVIQRPVQVWHRNVIRIEDLPRAETETTKCESGESDLLMQVRAAIASGTSKIARCRRYVRAIEPSISGQEGSIQALKAAFACHGFGLSKEEAMDLLMGDWNASCVPPWSEREMQHKVDDAYRLAEKPAGHLLGVRTGEERIEPYEEMDYPVELLPEPIRSYLVSCQDSVGFDPGFVGPLLIANLSGMIGTTREVRLWGDWIEPSTLWAAAVLESGSMKTPAARAASIGVPRLVAQAAAAYKDEADQYRKDLQKWNDAAKGKRGDKPEKPPYVRPTIDDVTIEALADVLQENPRGVLMCKDELSQWLAGLGQYKSSRVSADAPAWLKLYDNDRLQVDRRNREFPIYVERPAVAISGCIQPKVLRRLVSGDGRSNIDNGLLPRFMLCRPRAPDGMYRESTIDPHLREDVIRLFDLLWTTVKHKDERPLTIELDAEAKSLFIEFNDHVSKEVVGEGDDFLRAVLSKSKQVAARVALTLHVVTLAFSSQKPPTDTPVTAKAVKAGIAIARWHVVESRKMFGALLGTDADVEADDLLRFIERRGNEVSLTDIRRCGPARYRSMDTEDLAKVLASLERLGWGVVEKPRPGPQGGRPATRFRKFVRRNLADA